MAQTTVGTERINYDPAKQKDNCYFASMIRRYPDAPNFIVYLKPEQIQRSAKERIFREMVRGQINYAEYGQYYQDSKFLENLIIAANDELISNATLRDALAFYDLYCPGQQNVITCRARHENLVYVYYVILTKLNEVKFYNNVGYLADLQYILNGYRNAL